MDYEQLTTLHLTTVAPAAVIGAYILLNPKGTPVHRALGKIYMLLMLITALLSLMMPAKIGPALFGHFGVIHLLSLVALSAVIGAYRAARQGDIRRHKLNMYGLYVGGVLVAGGFTLMPGRYLNTLLFGS